MLVTGNLFYTRWTDQQLSLAGTPTGNPFIDQFNFYTTNAGESEMYGLELTVEGDATDNLSLFASLGYSKTSFLDFKDPISGIDYAGNRFPSSPEKTFALGGQYVWDNGLTIGMDAAFTGETYTDADNAYSSDDYWVVNMQATYEWDNGLKGGLYVRNLLDNDYVIHRSGAPRTPEAIVRVGEPRTIGAYLTASF